MIKRILGVWLILCSFLSMFSQAMKPSEPVISEIWNSAPHNAFTDLIYQEKYFYCSFREGSGHIPGTNGIVRVLRSADGKTWEDFTTIRKEGVDLRDPKLSVMPDGRIMCIMGGSVYDTVARPAKLLKLNSQVSYLNRGAAHFTYPEGVNVPWSGSSWIWRVTWYNGLGFAINYIGGFSLLKTVDGKTFTKVSDLKIEGDPNESTIQFDKKGRIYVMVRRDKPIPEGVLAVSDIPYKDWTYKIMNERVGGPNFLFSPNGKKLIAGTRLYESAGAKTGILITDLKGKTIKKIVLESGGDCSYPGIVIRDNKLWYSYYSSHQGRASIYFTALPLKDLLRR